MSYSLTWLPTVLTAAGLKVVEVPGWQTRGHGEFGPDKGVLLHHTAGAMHGNIPSLDILVHGRTDLSGPLCNLGLARDGTFYVIAAGRAYHAGPGVWHSITNGNSELIGIEMENHGTPDDPWPAVQLDAARRGVAALLKHIGAQAVMVAGHKEYCVPKGRKIDPWGIDCETFRVDVGAILSKSAHL